jgi:hypothetical protein
VLRPALLLAAALAIGCAGANGRGAPRPPSGLGDGAARETLRRFGSALLEGDAGAAVALLSSRWRPLYTPARLAVDWNGAGPSAREAAEAVLAALASGVALERGGGTARLPLGGNRAARLVAEDGAWRVDALE